MGVPDAQPPPDLLQAALRRAIDRAAGRIPEVPSHLRFELRRKALHVVAAVVAVPMLLVLPFLLAVGLAVAGVLVIILTWAIERRRLPPTLKGPLHEEFAHVLATTRREGEDFPWSPVLYTLALVLLALAAQYLGLSLAIAFAAYAILGIGDAASALVGVAYGRHKLPWNRRKSVEGTVAGLAAGFMSGTVMGAVPYAFVSMFVPPAFLPVVLAGAIAGALAETLPRVEDNVVVPLAAASTMWGVALLLGVPLP